MISTFVVGFDFRSFIPGGDGTLCKMGSYNFSTIRVIFTKYFSIRVRFGKK